SIHRLTPHGIVNWIWLHRIECGHNALILVRIQCIVWTDKVVALAIAISVDNQRCPALRRLFVASLLEFFHVEPTDDAALRPALASPQRVVRIVTEIKMMGAEAGTD